MKIMIRAPENLVFVFTNELVVQVCTRFWY